MSSYMFSQFMWSVVRGSPLVVLKLVVRGWSASVQWIISGWLIGDQWSSLSDWSLDGL